jgi:predicted DNA-binding protein
MGMKRTHIFLPEPLKAALHALSEKTGMSVAEHIRRAIDAYLAKLKDKK